MSESLRMWVKISFTIIYYLVVWWLVALLARRMAPVARADPPMARLPSCLSFDGALCASVLHSTLARFGLTPPSPAARREARRLDATSHCRR